MKTKRILFCIALALLFMLGTLRPGCRILLNGTVVPGIYDLPTARRCAAMARRTAQEITRSGETDPFTLIPVLCHSRDETDETLLYHTLLESYADVEKLYAVSAEGEPIGLLKNLWEVTALLREYPTSPIQITHIYSHGDAAHGLRYVRAALKEWESGSVGPF